MSNDNGLILGLDGKTASTRTHPLAIINYALAADPDSITLLNFSSLVRRVSIKRITAPPRDGFRPEVVQIGRVLVEMPAVVARTLKLPLDQRDFLFLVHVDHDTAERAASGLIV